METPRNDLFPGALHARKHAGICSPLCWTRCPELRRLPASPFNRDRLRTDEHALDRAPEEMFLLLSGQKQVAQLRIQTKKVHIEPAPQTHARGKEFASVGRRCALGAWRDGYSHA